MESNQMVLTAQKLIEYAWMHKDSEKYAALISDDAKIELIVNGNEIVRHNKESLMSGLKKRNFENTHHVKLLNASFEVTGVNTLRVKDRSLQQREGHGRQESGVGLYYIDSVGELTFANENGEAKVTHMKYQYSKIKAEG